MRVRLACGFDHDPSGSGLILNARFRGQEGAAESAPMHAHLGVLGVTGFLMKQLSANPLDYVEGGAFKGRRECSRPSSTAPTRISRHFSNEAAR